MNDYLDIEKLYMKFLNKEISYNEKIRDFEDSLTFNEEVREKSQVFMEIENKINKLINHWNYLIIWIKKGFALVLKYDGRGYDDLDDQWVYLDNKFYLIDLRNNKYFDVSKVIEFLMGDYYIAEFRESDIFKFYKLDVDDILLWIFDKHVL